MKELFNLTSIMEAKRILQEVFKPQLKVEKVSLDEGMGRIAAQDIHAIEQVPNFSRSTKDGYALNAKDTHGASEALPGLLGLREEILMGKETTFTLDKGQSAYIPTGGMLPEGADAVLMIEYADLLSDDELLAFKEVASGENVVRKGEDVEVGDLLVPAGKRLRPQELGLLASQGIVEIPVFERFRVGILSTGNEIVAPETTPKMGEIRDVNSYILRGEVRSTGAVAKVYPVARDEYQHLYDLVAQAFAENHMVLISGGSSVGTRDYCLKVLMDLTGTEPLFHGIPLKPGKPALGATKDGKVLLGLPGHPVSSRTVFDVLAKPLLRTEADNLWQNTVQGVLTRNVPSEAGRDDHIKVQVRKENGEIVIHPLLGVSGIVSLLTEGDGEIIIPAGTEGFPEGKQVTVYLY
jgi:molybdopterin molybdotransferase